MDRPLAAGSPTQALRFDANLIRKYDGLGPRYTSYPTADRFDERFTESTYCEALAARQSGNGQALSLYVHLPFCSTICYYLSLIHISEPTRP